MKILKTTDELRAFRASLKGSVGFVPTMGALHAGHASLISQSTSQNEHTIVSVFVNPTQFLAGEDLEKYPRQEEADIKLCQSLGVGAVFMPNASEIYKAQSEAKIIAPHSLASVLEGASRPGHFDGVLQVLNKLFHLVSPDNAYFGKKDAQQLAIVQNFVQNSFWRLNIVPCEIVREPSGLALSSRNAYLSKEQKQEAAKLSKALFAAKDMIKAGELDTARIKAKMAKVLAPHEAEYIAFVRRDFTPLDKIELENSIILVAVKFENTRLIDNIWI